MSSVLKLRVCHFSYFTLVTEGALIIFFLRKKRQGALIGAGALNGANTVISAIPIPLQLTTNGIDFQFLLKEFETYRDNLR